MMMPFSAAAKILALDTSTMRGSVALLEGREVVAELRLNSTNTHSALLLKSIDFLLDRLGWTLKDLTLVAAGIGPGSFTGIRIGISTALGISQSLGIPYAGVSGFDALVHQAEFLDGPIGVILDAHRSQVFYAEYSRKKGKVQICGKSSLIGISDLESRLSSRHLYIIGDLDVCRFRQWDGSSSGWPRAVSVDLFLASSIGRLAFARKRIRRSGDYIVSEPLYIRPPDALRNKARKR
jgi:tRNA threonylcarbamoyladenosine biosynthesis protein TsaB